MNKYLLYIIFMLDCVSSLSGWSEVSLISSCPYKCTNAWASVNDFPQPLIHSFKPVG